MRCILCAVALSCILSSNAWADEIVIVPTSGQLTWTHFQGPASDVASLTITAPGFFFQATNQDAIGKAWSGLCPINCTGTAVFNGFAPDGFSWNVGTDGVTASGTIRLFPPGSVPFPPGNPPTPVFTLVFTATGTVLVDTPERFVFVFNDQTAIPEPLSMLLFGSGLAGISSRIWRSRLRDRVKTFSSARKIDYPSVMNFTGQ